ncbi:MAG: eukaryotic-like serine/threonine-protein kinase [Gammaproteobacteria bacterium]|nr:eukaryotic-like serine/threonine-protein kinase [Gammaproteobacteria bacterium]
MAEVRNNWEGRIINGVFPLRRFLGSSNHSSVFLTESAVEGFLNAAIKIVPADPAHSSVQLWQWKTAATFSHPHLIRLLDSGQCEIDGSPFLFVVMEYAEESLSQILPYRALAPDEVRELLVPTLDALAFLHGENWIQGQLKPSNFLVVDDQLKLATDTIRPVAVSQVGPPRPTLYEPPESDAGEVSAASDVWALGVTMTEALTQYPPTWLNGRDEEPSYPTNLPPIFADTVQRCLSRNPADRPTVAELQVQTKPAQSPPPEQPRPVGRPEPVPLVARPQVVEQPMRADSRPFSEFGEEPKRGVLVPALIALVVVGAAIWGGTRLLRGPATPEQTAAAVGPGAAAPEGADSTGAATESATPVDAPPAERNTAVPTAPPASTRDTTAPTAPAAPTRNSSTATTTPTAPSRSSHTAASNAAPPPPRKSTRDNASPAAAPASAASSGSAAAVHEEIPNVPLSARGTIHGHVKVGVRVTVDHSGRVVHDSLDNPGPSRYFNRVATEAARKWRFAAADNPGSREWLLRFEFGREGTTVHAVGPRS